MPRPRDDTCRTVFATELGWMAVVGTGEVLRRLVFGYPSAAEAERALGADWLHRSRPADWNPRLRALLERYAAGQRIEFDRVSVEIDGLTEFARRVLQALQKVPYGQTVTYGALAAQAGSPRAARAVGNCMAANPIPLVLPCHRVVCASQRIGRYSAPGGSATKRRLLQMERSAGAATQPGSLAPCPNRLQFPE